MFDIPIGFTETLRHQNDKLLTKLNRIIELLESLAKSRPTPASADGAGDEITAEDEAPYHDNPNDDEGDK